MIGKRTLVYHPELSNIHPDASIGDDCVIHSHVWLGAGVIIGNRVKIQAFAFLPLGVIVRNDVFIGPRCTFLNDRHPPSGARHWERTIVEEGAVIGAGAVILPGLTIGAYSTIGAGAVVTKSVEPHTTVVGNPARVVDSRTPNPPY